ncbi:hypothetical protein Tco_0680405 [Tanacetum coccineum]|uniref:Reverse transcriptase Ty1/copia-type domain-containing protein n=1 Tax=Tanacetum coccineum TaxID=301880 RepID=A0ABQ4XLE0_9ASTR
MGELTFFLGLQVKQKEDGIFISQDKYVGEILMKFGFSSIRIASTPMETNKDLTKDEDGKDVDIHLYMSMIGSLMYLTSSRPDIMFSVCACSRFQVQPKVSHLNAVKRIFRYLKGRPKLGLWKVHKQRRLSISWFKIQNQMLDYGYNFMQTKIHVDNESAICVVKNPVYHSKIKHKKIRHHFIRDSYEKRLIEMVKIHTDNNVADLLTKAFDGRLMVYKCSELYTSAIWIKVGRVDEVVHKEGGDSVERAITTAASLDAAQDSDNIIRTQTTAMPNVDIPQGMDTGGSPRRQDTMGGALAQTRFERVLEQPNEPPLSEGGHTPRSDEDKANVMQLLKWKLHENCGVHTLFMDGTPMAINMLVEKKYPLTKELLEKMLTLQLEAKEVSTMAFELIKFIKSMLEE